MAKIYTAGHCLTKGSQMQREAEKRDLLNLGHELYVPQDNKEINDKANANYDGLAERIVHHDTEAIKWSDVVVIEPLAEACGTMVELGQIKGMKDIASQVLNLAETSPTPLEDIITLCKQQEARMVLPHFEDVRRVADLTETGDRRSLGINQYVYGVCLELTNGKGFYEWDEITHILDTKNV
ncbi:hypothetical protein AG74_123 [Vibrio phage AG74]|uniref:Nucleoside 2-deoxyribosyltransferase n=1 Tax=Vibrio phage AG74 TaxID=2736261 RepID=A0A6M9Z169_9CAUD|nr:nucleoside 2-deoxyribosyltransferase [Vibrio phage AG74]QKN84963.1 hypothetical protein AG74_123 [Vibrio phage AG74]